MIPSYRTGDIMQINVVILCRHFLLTNKFYDELLAVNIAGQTSLWNILHHLAAKRGLFAQVLDVLMKKSSTPNSTDFDLASQNSSEFSLVLHFL